MIMICPKCGNEIEEGHLYCEVCGEEIQIVPDFDLQVEESIHVTLSSVAGDVKPEQDLKAVTKELPTQEVVQVISTQQSKPSPTRKKRTFPQIPRRYLLYGGAALGILIIVLILIFTLKPEKVVSYEERFAQAQESFRQQNYEETVASLQSLMEEEKREEVILLLADSYLAMKDPGSAVSLCREALARTPDDPKLTRKLLDALIEKEDYDAVGEILTSTGDESVRSDYAAYLAPEPLFSLDSGTYTDDEQLSLIAESDGSIYYTLDGSDPTNASTLYRTPFVFDVGEHTVTAVFINTYGISSDPVQKKYVIEKKMLDDPVLLTEGGKYSDPLLISLEKPVGAVIYYTDDGTEPGPESNVYNQPIPMPIGEKTFKFIMIDPEGVTSNVIEATYNLQMAALIDVKMAEAAVPLMLKVGGNGVKQSEYLCTSACRFQDRNYYLVEEYSLQTADKVKTGRVFAVDVLTGELYKADMSSAKGEYQLTPFAAIQ